MIQEYYKLYIISCNSDNIIGLSFPAFISPSAISKRLFKLLICWFFPLSLILIFLCIPEISNNILYNYFSLLFNLFMLHTDGIFFDIISIIIFTKLSDTVTFFKPSILCKLRSLTERILLS